jgi:arylsulfatase
MPEHAIKPIHLFLVLVASVFVSPTLVAAGNDEKPNVVFILMDNFGWGEIGVYGGGELRGAPTPMIDSLAHEGLRLTNYNVEAECVPSRASLMTGRYGIRTRQRPGGPTRGTWYGITKWEETLAEVLSDSGYTTALFGKWHLGDTEGRFPTDQGFDEWIGIPRSSDRAFWPDSNSYNPNAHPDAVFTRIMRAKRGETPTEHEVFDREKRKIIDREITDQSIDFIKRKADGDKPFFVFLSYTQTHEPVDPHPDYYGKTGHGSFADVLAQTDDYVGEVLETLDDLDLKENTIVIFTSDNGREGLPRSFGFTGPWRAGMFSPYEGSLRVPFLIRWPGKVPEQRVSNEMMHAVDLLPTLAAIVGKDLPEDRVYDGVDQTDFLTGKKNQSARESVVIYLGNVLFGVKWRNWKLLLREMDEGTYAIKEMAYPSVYNLIVDPKEEVPELNYLNDTWVDFPLYQVLGDHEASIEADPGAPDP